MKTKLNHTIGVVVTTFNGECFIEEQIESILNQTLKPDLIVVVDDKSTDNTAEIVKKYSLEYNNIKFYQNVQNIGYIQNFEKGISLCNTDYIALCDQDNVWFPEKLEKCFQKLSSAENGGLCYHNSALIYEDGKPLNVTLWDLSRGAFPLSKQNARWWITNRIAPVPGFAIFFHSDLKKHILPMPGKKFCGHDWWISAVSFFVYTPICIEAPLTYYRLHPKQASGGGAMILKNTEYEIKKKMFDLDRIRRNIKREIYKIFYRKKIRAAREKDEENLRKEFASAFERLAKTVDDHCSDSELTEKEVIIKSLLEERQKLLSKNV